jgi:homoserine dehydrogenase
MKQFNIAVLGCGTVGSGVCKILLDMKEELSQRAGLDINLSKIVELSPKNVAEKLNIPLNLFCGDGKDISVDEANKYIDEINNSSDIDLVVETIGGSSEKILNLALGIINAKKHFVTANKALLAIHGQKIYEGQGREALYMGIKILKEFELLIKKMQRISDTYVYYQTLRALPI